MANEVLILSFEGALYTQENGHALLDVLDGANGHVVLNCRDIAHINSAGIGILLATLQRLRKAGGDLVLSEPSDAVPKMLELVALRDVFEFFDSDDAALVGLAGDGDPAGFEIDRLHIGPPD